jgi:hypothetical protein
MIVAAVNSTAVSFFINPPFRMSGLLFGYP